MAFHPCDVAHASRELLVLRRIFCKTGTETVSRRDKTSYDIVDDEKSWKMRCKIGKRGAFSYQYESVRVCQAQFRS